MHRSVVLLCGLALGATWVACRPGGPTAPSVDVPVGSVTLAPETAEVPVDGQLELEAVVRDEEGEPLPDVSLQWSSSDPDVASVDEQGVVTGRSPGTITIRASLNGVEGTAGVEVRGFLVGPAGGSARSTDGNARLEVPAGALSEETVLTVEPAGDSDLPGGSAAEGFVAGSAYELRREGGQLTDAARLTIRYDPGRIPSNAPESSLRLRRVDGASWRAVSGASVEASADEVRGDVDRAGIYGAVGEVSHEPPEAHIERPRDGDTFRAGDRISFHGTGEGSEDGTLGGSSLVWRSNRDGQLGTGERVERDDLSIGTHQITLTVTDSRGQTGTDRVDIEVRNTPPEAEIEKPEDGAVFHLGRSITFEGRAEDREDGDLEGDALVWTSSIDGEFGRGEKVTTDDLSEGEHVITLKATDSRGQTGTDRVDIEVRNTPPEAEIERPRDGETFRARDKISFRGTGEDAEDGKLSGSSLVWRSNRDGQLGTGEKVERDDLSIGTHEITLRATDSRGQTGTDRVEIEVRNTPPEAEIEKPEDGDVFRLGRSIDFEGEAKDREDGDLKGDALVWTSSIDGEFGRGDKVTTDDLSEGEHVITLTATDSHGAEATDQIAIRVIRIF